MPNDALDSDLTQIRSSYVRDRYAFVPGEKMVRIVQALGATDEDLDRLVTVSDALESDPTLPFRKTRTGRFGFDPVAMEVRRLEFQPFMLSTEDDFVRHDAGKVRVFDEIRDDLQLNTALKALFVFKFLVFDGMTIEHRPKLDYDSDRWVCTLLNVRTTTDGDLIGEPALEGVHSDGVDHTMTTYLGSQNMTEDSAVTFLHEMDESNGTRWHDTDPKLVRARAQHRDFLDTCLIVDHELKHSVSTLYAADPERPATRDLLAFLTRKPVAEGHHSREFDSAAPHPAMPMTVPLRALGGTTRVG
ncbi:2OG-Fe dioxygenase family protein [Streptomyces malaysiensis]|uniref:2OG-Fe dioxygenase family protein n=1 Tax=Streptomyces malaysiensis TaxID=92644 RepID=UPI000852C5B4|nr:2OG-Fe dioxygenase family protein [Streptomyces sp. SPMA113]MCC4316799.1 2OG-Fe dioxygenase family protein [Streptomyces malaysiensis]